MPRVRPAAGGRPGGIRVQGLYAELLESERDKHARHPVDPRWKYTEAGLQGLEPPPKYLRPRGLLDRLEAGQPVTVAGYAICRRAGVQWPPELCQRVTVTVDDVVRPADPQSY